MWIAFADFFLVIALVAFASDYRRGQKARLATAALNEELRKTRDGQKGQDSVINDLQRQLKDYIEVDNRTKALVGLLGDALRKRGVAYQIDAQQAAVVLPELTLFESSSWELRETSTVARVAEALLEIGDKWQRGFVLVIRGHTDGWPVTDRRQFSSNLELSRMRARSFEEALGTHGIAAPRFQVVSQGRGEFEPRVDNCQSPQSNPALPRSSCNGRADLRPKKDVAPNRRIELRFGLFTGNSL